MWKALPLCSLRRLASLLVLLMVVKRLVEKQQTRRIPLHCSLGDQVAFLGDKDRDDGHQRKKIRAEMKDPLTAEGVCGPIMRSMKIPLDDDSEIDWWFLHPCAFLHELCKKCPRLGDLLGSVDKHKISVYMDEIKPGNVLRPDPGQSVAMWYWTLNDLPDWYHARNEGWFYFAAFPVNLIGQVVGGYSYLFARAMDFFGKKKSRLISRLDFLACPQEELFFVRGNLELFSAMKNPSLLFGHFVVPVVPSHAVSARMLWGT